MRNKIFSVNFSKFEVYKTLLFIYVFYLVPFEKRCFNLKKTMNYEIKGKISSVNKPRI